jgi:FlaA1/EpsC-like NDP-sugar epimerase
MQRLNADIIFHCAAYKHVPMTEANPVEAVKNNVFGTHNLVEAAHKSGTDRFVFISTDKAVQPLNVYGATKSIAEKIVLHSNRSTYAFMVVRFGNVLGSRGSIVPLFRKQILKGGPVTITHPEMKRFFMTIPEAVSLVLQTGGIGKGGNLYILDMGEPIKIRELAEQMIKFHGFEPHKEIPIRYIGLRPGEKIQEQLWTEHDKLEKTENAFVNRLVGNSEGPAFFEDLLNTLRPICFFDPTAPEVYRNRRKLKEILAGYIPTLARYEHEPEY